MQADILLFDMDGTLIDSAAAIEKAWQNWAAKYDLDADAVYAYSHGRKATATIRHFAPPSIDVEADSDTYHADLAGQTDKITAIAGATALLDQLRPAEWAIVTSAPRDLAVLNLRAVGLPVPNLIIGADQVMRSKPDPEGYQMAAVALGTTADKAIVFEDAEAGLIAGRAAGAQIVGVGHGGHPEHLADRWVMDLTGIEVTRASSLTLNFNR